MTMIVDCKLKGLSMKFKYTCVVLLSFTLGATYYFTSGDREGFHKASLFLGACNLSMFVLYLYATFFTCKSRSDYTFKLAVLISVLIYATIYLLTNIKLYTSFKTEHPGQYPEGYVVYLSVAVLTVMIAVLLQTWKTRKTWQTVDK